MDAEAFERLVAAGRADPAVARLAARIGRGVTFERDGRAHVVVAGPAADVVVQAPAQVWDAMLAPLPAPVPVTDMAVDTLPRLALSVTPDAGDGRLCLFLHGIGGGRTNWRPQLQAAGLGRRSGHGRCRAAALPAILPETPATAACVG